MLVKLENECSRFFLTVNFTSFQGVSLCEEYDVDAETFIEQWMAFSLSHLNGAAPSIENLELLARKEFSKRAASRLNAPAKTSSSSTGSSLTVYGAPVSTQYPFQTHFPRVLLLALWNISPSQNLFECIVSFVLKQ